MSKEESETKNTEEIYKKILEVVGIANLKKKMEDEKDWSNPKYRMVFGNYFRNNPTAYVKLSEDVYREEINYELNKNVKEANENLYSNFYKILKEKKEEEIADLMSNLPYIETKIEDEKLKKIAELHNLLYFLTSLSLEEYRELRLRSGAEVSKAYIIKGMTKDLLQLEKEADVMFHKNELIRKLKELKEESQKK